MTSQKIPWKKLDPLAGNKKTGVNSKETKKQNEQGSDPPTTNRSKNDNGNPVLQIWESGRKFVKNMLNGNKNVDKLQQNTDTQEKKNGRTRTQ